MGRDDVIMDNGKKAQGSMARYWKKQKERQKNKDHHRPNETKRPTEGDGQEQVDVSKVAYDKWKNHQLDMQMKKYGGKQEGDQPQQHQREEQPAEEPRVEQSYDALTKKMDNRQLVIPGYGKTSALQKKLNIIEAPKMKPKPPPKAGGIPEQLKGLFGSEAELQQILMMNKQKKKLKALAKQEERAKRNERSSMLAAGASSDPFERTLQDEGYNPTKKPEESESEQQKPVVEQKLFKSDVLNKLMEGNKLQQIINKPQEKQQAEVEQPQISVVHKPMFVPRAARKNPPPQ